MKKVLSIWLAVILIAVNILPITSFADVAAEYVIDVSTSNEFSIPIGTDNKTYVLTGTNKDAEVYISRDCNIILRNATLRRIRINYADSYTVNITLEGENTIDQYNWASQGALEIYSSHVTINGGENDSLYAKSLTFSAYGPSWNGGSLTVNGGNITFESTSASGGSPLQVKYIQNGGTVKVISSADFSFMYELYLNAGSLEILHNASYRGAFGDYVKIKAGASMKLSSPSKAFDFYGLIGLAEDAAISDHLVVRFDESSDFVALDKLNTILNGKNYAQIKVESHTENYENGVCGDCGVVCTHDTDDGTCGVCSKYIYKFTHQPTDKEPYVTLNNSTDAVYQWYKMSDTAEITDSDEIYLWSDFFGEESEESSYDSKFGWSPIILYDSDDYVDYIIADFKAGDTVILEFTSPVYLAYMSNIAEEAEVEFTIDGNIATGIVETDGAYVVWAEAEGTKPSVKIYRGAIAINALSGETSATLANPTYGAYYYCEATAGDGTVLVSRFVDFSYRITHHPTPAEMYVTLSVDAGAIYQWYKGERGLTEITDDSVTYPWSSFDAPFEVESTYSAENGWSAINFSEEGNDYTDLYYIIADFAAGDEVTLEFSSSVDCVELFNMKSDFVACDIDGNIATGIVETAGAYGIYASTENTIPSVKVYKNDVLYTAVAGATGSAFTPDEFGRYYCEVTFANGEKKKSKAADIGCFHDFEAQVIAPTCTEDGYTAYTCSICGEEYEGNKVAALGHTPVTDAAVAPDCTQTGLTEGKHCSVCGAVTLEQTVVAALGHDEIFHQGQTATCTQSGWCDYVTCSRCDYTTYQAVDASGHSWVDATCEDAKYCRLCGEVDGEALGHDSVRHEGKEATCTEWGYYEYETCNRCEFSTYCEIPPLEHKWYAANCTRAEFCERCRTTRGEALGHDYEWCEAKAPTCTEFGWKEYQACKRCTYTTIELISSLGYDSHDLISHGAQAPTCTEVGWDAYETCSRCSYTTYVETEATGHSWSTGSCTTLQVCSECGITGTQYAHTWVDASCSAPKTCSECNATEGEALGHNMVSHEAQAATCTEKGWMAYESCTRCDYTTKEEIDALGHDLKFAAAHEPTCTQYGWEEYEYCSRCFYTTFQISEALGHSWVDATCTVAKKCSACEITEGDALGHNIVSGTAQTPTCTEKGWDAYEFCTRCDYTTKAEMDALGHDEIEHAAKAATCTASGWDAYVTCSRCDHSTYTESPATGHLYGEWIAEIPATCMAAGTLGHYTCSACSANFDAEKEELADLTIALNASAHEWNAGAITVVAGCHQMGIRTYTCSHNNAHTRTEEIGYDANNHFNTVQTDAVSATCTAVGYDAGVYCKDCEAYVSGHEEIKALGHAEENRAGQEPTCSEIGYTAGVYCTRCETYISGHEEIEALGHDEIKHAAKTATCTAIGWDAYVTCSRCDYTTYEEIPMAEHDWAEAECSIPSICLTCGVESGNAIGHSYTVFVETVDNTCTKDGFTTYKCVRCTETENRDIVPAAHLLEQTDAKAATCTEIGWNAYVTCSRCDYSTYEEIEALGHGWSEWTVRTPATQESDGEEFRTCSTCGQEETRVIEKLPTSSDELVIEAENGVAKVSTDGFVVAKSSSTVGQLLAASNGTVVLTAKGARADDAAKLATGMKLVILDGETVVDSMEIVVFGDVDGDGIVNASDARIALRISVKLENYAEDSCYYKAAKVDSKNKVSAADARMILRASVKLEDEKSWFTNFTG